jgi:hypothetical protein
MNGWSRSCATAVDEASRNGAIVTEQVRKIGGDVASWEGMKIK